MKKILSIFGTRPEAIKMAPVVKGLEKMPQYQSVVLVTGQHREMLDSVMEVFDVKVDYDLEIMAHGQTIIDIITKSMKGIDEVIKKEKPDLVLVHGDTSTSAVGAQVAFLNKVAVGHVEAGLRTHDKYSPFPEEMNRKMIGAFADLHFSATEGNKENLLKEGITENIFVTGNTVIDALLSVIEEDYTFEEPRLNAALKDKKVIAMTCHRRENWGQPMADLFDGVREIVEENEDLVVVYPVHLNPNIVALAEEKLGGHDRIFLIKPLSYVPFANLINQSYMIFTDSGGIQEEAPALGKPVLVMRTETERPEAVKANTVAVVGNTKKGLLEHFYGLYKDPKAFEKMSQSVNPYGTGQAVENIIKALDIYFNH